MKYYRIRTEEIIDTVNPVPEEKLEEKGLLKYKLNTINIYDDETRPDNYSEEINGEWVETVYNVIHRKTLEEVKEDKLDEIKETYTQISNEGFECSNGIKLDCRESDKINWLTCKLQGGVVDSIKDFDNIVHTDLSSEVVITMLTELETYYKKILSDKWTVQELVKSCTTIEEVDLVYWRKPIYLDDNMIEFSHYEYNEEL